MNTPASRPPKHHQCLLTYARRILWQCAATVFLLLGSIGGALHAADSVEPPWASADVGGPGQTGAGAFYSNDSSYYVNAGGADIWGGSDQFHFDYYRLRGDGTLTARITSISNTDTWAKAGVMMRTTLDGNSAYAGMFLTYGQGAAFQWRTNPGDQTSSTNVGGVNTPGWVRIQRTGGTLTGSTSSDGNNWTVRGTTNVGLSDPLYIGLAVTAHNNGALNGTRFEGVTAVPEQAVATDRFVDSLGVCTHWNYGGTPYTANASAVKSALLDLGVRHYRDGLFSVASDLAPAGVRATVVAEASDNANSTLATIQSIVSQIQSLNGNAPGSVVEAVEGPNEPDYFWGYLNRSYNGNGFPTGAIQFQQDLYRTLKGNPATAALPVFGMALATHYGYGGNPIPNGALTDSVDYGNFHPYPGGNTFSPQFGYDTVSWYIGHGTQPSANLDEWPYSFEIYQPPYGQKSMVATETGYFTGSATHSLNQTVFAKYAPRLYLEYFRRGIARTFLYEFVDEGTDTGDKEKNFGLLYNNASPKPAYTALKSLIGLLKEPGASFVPGNLAVSYQVNPPGGYDRTQYVRHVLMQRSNGEFYLVLYHEIADSADQTTTGSDISGTTREINPPDISTTINLPASITAATRYTYDGNWNLQPTSLNVSSHQITVAVQDRVQVIKLSAGIPEGDYRLSPRNATGQCLDASGPNVGSNVWIYQYYAIPNQKWHVSPAGNGAYRLSPLNAPDQCLDVEGGPAATTNGANVHIWTYGGATNQQWTITPTDGGFYRLSPLNAPDKCLDIEGGPGATSNASNVHIWAFGGGTNQQWTLQAP